MDDFLDNLAVYAVTWIFVLSTWHLGNRLSPKAKYRTMLALSIIATPIGVLGALISIIAPFFNSPVARDELIIFWGSSLIWLLIPAVPIWAVKRQRRLYIASQPPFNDESQSIT